MADEPVGMLSFVSLVRRGLAAGIETPDEGQVGPQSRLQIETNFGGSLTARAQLSLVSPGDIVGLDSRVVVRTFPKPDEVDAEVDHFALIEFDQADLPWRYTPARENTQSQLRPWINLIVLEAGEAGIQPPSGSQKLAIVTAPLASLPDLSQSWAWAHTQIEGTGFTNDNPAPILERLEGAPGLFVARLIAPRVLEASTSYVACLVPTFERGRLVGIGEDPGNTDALMPAWSASGPATVR